MYILDFALYVIIQTSETLEPQDSANFWIYSRSLIYRDIC